MLEIKNITKRFGGVKALERCNFDVPANKITAIVGPNGAGKTTLLDIISGLIRADQGQVFSPLSIRGAGGVSISKLQPHQIANLGISRTFQQVRLFKHLTILDHLLISEDNNDTKLWHNILKSNKLKTSELKERKKYIEGFGIDKNLKTEVADMSYGQRKLLQLAMALRKHHHLLLLDEPVAGVNAVIQKKIEDLILKLKDKGETIIIIEHDMDFVRRLADYIVVLDEGKLLLDGPPNKVLSNKKVLEAYLGE